MGTKAMPRGLGMHGGRCEVSGLGFLGGGVLFRVWDGKVSEPSLFCVHL